MKPTIEKLIAITLFGSLSIVAAGPREDAARIVSQIQRADYEGNQQGMQQSYDELTPFLKNKELVSRIRYWRGFAQWRRAINGFNDAVDMNEIEQDLNLALEEFKQALAADPSFVDAKIGMISALGYLAFMNVKDQERAKQFVGQILPLVKEAIDAAPDNPRLIWVRGPIFWNTPAERGGGQDKTIENYERGLTILSKARAADDPLEPSWGKPELMMSLAYSYANKQAPDIAAAERNARTALELVPNWHYVRDILLPQILKKKSRVNL